MFPVYFYGIPTVLAEFVDQKTIKNDSKPFICSLITCAGSIGNADKMLKNYLRKQNLHLNSSFSVKMPNNYNIMSNLSDKEKENLVLQNAEKEINNITELLKEGKEGNFAKHGYIFMFTPIVYPLYGIYRNTKKFYATDACNSCGSYAEIALHKLSRLKIENQYG